MRFLFAAWLIFFCSACGRVQVQSSQSTAEVQIEPAVKKLVEDIQSAKNDRNWPAVLSLQAKLADILPQDESPALDRIDSYLTVEDFTQAQQLSEDLLRHHPKCSACCIAYWNVLRERDNRSPESIAAIKDLVYDFKARLLNPNLQSDWFALYQGMEMIGDEVEVSRCREKIFRLVKRQGFADAGIKNFMADQFYVDLLRGQPTLSAKQFVEMFPDFSQIDLIYNLELNRRVAKAQGAFFKYPVISWSKKWIRERPDSRKAHFASAGAFRTLGIKRKKALEYLDHTLWLIENRGQVYREPLYSDAAWVQRLQESRNMVLQQRAWYWHLQGESQRAFAEFQTLEKNFPKDGEFHFHFARVAMALGKDDVAEHYFLKAIDLGADPSSVLQNLRTLRNNKELTIESVRDELWQGKSKIIFKDVSQKSNVVGFAAQFVSFADFDQDGDEDLLLSGGPVPGLFENKKNEKGEVVFENVWPKYGPKDIVRFGSGIWADVDQDGDLDLFLTMVLDAKGNMFNHLLINQLAEGKGFIDCTESMFPPLPIVVTAAAAFGDVDADGFPDLYVANYEKNGDPLARGTTDFFLKNVKGKKFVEVAHEIGCHSAEPMCGRGVAWADYDNDGDQDIFVANYRLDPNFLFQNSREKLTDVAKKVGVRGVGVMGNFGHSIGSEWGDLNNDGALDMVVGNLAHPRGLAYSNKTQILLQDPKTHHFVDTFSTSGVNYLETHSDPSLGDLDNDGDLDLILTAIYAGAPVTVYSNQGDGKFEDITFRSGISARNTWGGALADIDGDGDLDFVAASLSGSQVFENDSPARGFLQVCPRHRKTKSVVLGARVRVIQSGKAQIREVQGGKGTGNEHSLCVEFGFGSDKTPVDVEVRFPGGVVRRSNHVQINRMIEMER